MPLLLDTQVLVTVGLEGLTGVPAKVQKLLSDPNTELLLSAVSITEIAIKASIRKLEATSLEVSDLIADLKLTVIPFTQAHAYRIFSLPLHHREPFDRMMIATALHEGIPLVGGDDKFQLYESEGLQLIWK